MGPWYGPLTLGSLKRPYRVRTQDVYFGQYRVVGASSTKISCREEEHLFGQELADALGRECCSW